jgi:hypothetical protein
MHLSKLGCLVVQVFKRLKKGFLPLLLIIILSASGLFLILSTCFVVGCSTGYKSNKEKTPIFRAPKNGTNFVLWQKSIARMNRKFSRKDFVCAKHFKEEYIRKTRTILNTAHPLKVWKLA